MSNNKVKAGQVYEWLSGYILEGTFKITKVVEDYAHYTYIKHPVSRYSDSNHIFHIEKDAQYIRWYYTPLYKAIEGIKTNE